LVISGNDVFVQVCWIWKWKVICDWKNDICWYYNVCLLY